MVGVMPLAFLSGTEILFAIVIGLLLFGGQLPELIKDVGKVLFKTKRSLEKMRRESGIEDAIRDMKAEVHYASRDIPDWREAADLGDFSTEEDDKDEQSPLEEPEADGSAPEAPSAPEDPSKPTDS
jgi:Sec-independent protein translocase protein TatA